MNPPLIDPTNQPQLPPSTPSRIVLIGRAAGNDLVLRHPGVSARHARVIVAPDGLWLEDLGSRNGTCVGSPPQRITREPIHLDDTITLGNCVLPATALRDLLQRTQPRRTDAVSIDLESAGMVTFGRRAGAQVAIHQPIASAMHASVSVDRGRVIVRDLGSMSGTFVDGNRIQRPVQIGPGAIVQMADQRYRLSDDARFLEPLLGGSCDMIEAQGVAVEASGRRLLESVSLVVQPGELIAIMGPSGAGKSTLLSALNGQLVPSAGQVTIGGLDLHAHYELFRGRIGYVPQDDILHADLTVWQALWYAARLRLPHDTTSDEIASRIGGVIAQLGLQGTEQTRVGDQRKRGVSGGQRKRVNLAMELLTDPPILVLDEPTSGLSSTDALCVIELLRSLADAGKTILVTIHQPSLETFIKFDAVAVIARDASTNQIGRLAWFGRAWPDSVTFFEPSASAGILPANVDGMLRGLATRPVIEWVRQWNQSIAKTIWVDRRTSGVGAVDRKRARPSARAPARCMQWLTLVKRTLNVKAADGWNTAVLLLQAPIVALLIGAVFSKVLRTPPTLAMWPKAGVDMATTVFVTSLAAIWFGCSSTAREIVSEWPIYRRERMAGLSILSYVTSKMTVLLGIAAVQCGLLLGIVGWSCQLSSSWLPLFFVLYAAALAGGALGLFISALLRTSEAAAGVLPMMLLPMIVLGGILVPLADLPKLTQPLAAAMPSRWAFEGMVVREANARPRVRKPEHPQQPSLPTSTSAGQTGQFVLVAGSRSNGFILPGRQRMAEAMEDAAAEASRQMQQMERTVEHRAKAMKEQMQAESEKKVLAAEADLERRSATMSRTINAAMEKRFKEATDSLEQRLREMQQSMESQRMQMEKKLDGTMDELRGSMGAAMGSVVPPSAAALQGDIDMAERFFSRDSLRSPEGVPLIVLGGMFALGIVGTGVALAWRDARSRSPSRRK